MRYDLIIVGAGPAGMTAALYALRAEKSVLLLDSKGYGGQITLSACVENYPGAANINGFDLADAMMAQVRALGGRLENLAVTAVRKRSFGYEVQTASALYEARAVILATGVTHRKLGVPGEEDFIGKGVSFCAVCDGAFFRKKEVAVIGGGNTAVQDALYLAELCSKVYLIHRREGFRAEERLLVKARQTANLEILTDTVVTQMQGELRISALQLKNIKSGEDRVLPIQGVFEAIGSIPQNESFKELLTLDANGYFASGEDCTTALAGLFVAGDCRAKQIRQLTTATADGTVAALAAISYLDGVSS